MNKFFDYLAYDLPLHKVRELLDYIRRFAAVFAGDMPVEGKMGEYKSNETTQYLHHLGAMI